MPVVNVVQAWLVAPWLLGIVQLQDLAAWGLGGLLGDLCTNYVKTSVKNKPNTSLPARTTFGRKVQSLHCFVGSKCEPRNKLRN